MSRFNIGSVSGEGHSFGDGNHIVNRGPTAGAGDSTAAGAGTGGPSGAGDPTGTDGISDTTGPAGAGTERLTAIEIGELARVYPTPARSALLLRRAGFAPEVAPSPQGSASARDYWEDVAEWITYGRLPRGRRRLLDAAAADFPHNQVFRPGGADNQG